MWIGHSHKKLRIVACHISGRVEVLIHEWLASSFDWNVLEIIMRVICGWSLLPSLIQRAVVDYVCTTLSLPYKMDYIDFKVQTVHEMANCFYLPQPNWLTQLPDHSLLVTEMDIRNANIRTQGYHIA